MRILSFVIALLALLAAAPLHAEQTLVIGVPCMNAQCSFPEVEAVLREVYARAGLAVRFSRRPMLRDLVDANSGVIDGSLARTRVALEAYPNLVRIPVPLARTSIAALTLRPNIRVEGLRDLGAYHVGCLRGDTIAANLASMAGGVRLFNTYAELFRTLKKNRIDLALTHATLGEMAARAQNIEVRASPPLCTDYLYHCLHTKHADLASRLARALRDMRQDGTARRMFGPYLSMYPEEIPEEE